MSGTDLVAPVAVIGAGPVGKSAALLFAAYGIPCLLIERRTTPSDEPKAISIDDEALRTYQTAGILEEILPVIVPGLGTKYFDSDGKAMFLAGTAQSGRFGYPYKNPFAQPDLERVLHQAVIDQPLITTLLGHELTALRQDEFGVDLGVRTHDGADQSLRVQYVLGADGGRSAVRSLTKVPMVGRSLPETWIVLDTMGDPHIERYGLHYGTPDRPHVIVPGLDDRCRYEFRLFDGECVAGEEPAFELIEQLLRPYRTITAAEVERAVVYTFNGLNAERYQTGRTFLIGDAAHMMPPFAGQGLNSGIRDAMNLCWKIAAVLRGTLSTAALGSYHEERRPHAGAMVRLSERLGTIVMTTSERAARYRDRLVREALQDPDKRAWFEGMKYRPTARYTAGLVVGEHPLTGTQLNQPRVFDVTAGTIALLDERLGLGWAIVGVDVTVEQWGPVSDLADRYRIRCVHAQLDNTMPHGLEVEALIVDIDGGLERALDPAVNAGRFLLVRPDRFVAAVVAADEASTALVGIESWFGSAGPVAVQVS